MVPALVETTQNGNGVAHENPNVLNGHVKATAKLPLQSNGSLDDYDFKDLTPCIGREFPNANLVDIMAASNSDELLQELALTSMTITYQRKYHVTDKVQSVNVAWSGSASKTILPTTYRNNSSCG